jgi:uncharacterized paraquat-inducible protein A
MLSFIIQKVNEKARKQYKLKEKSKSMADIPAWVHIGLGIIIAILSSLNKKMYLFVPIGIGLLLWGIYRLFGNKKEYEARKKLHARILAQHNSHKKTENHAHNKVNHNTINHEHHKHCPNCRATIHKNYRFCPYCGFGI